MNKQKEYKIEQVGENDSWMVVETSFLRKLLHIPGKIRKATEEEIVEEILRMENK